MRALSEDMAFYAVRVLPRHLGHLVPLARKMALSDRGFVTCVLAFADGYLKPPADSRTGAFYTLMYADA